MGGRAGRQHLHVRQHGQLLGRGDRGGERRWKCWTTNSCPTPAARGKFRGGMAQRKTWRMLGDEGVLQVRADRQTHRPYGLQGGGPGAPGRNVMDPGMRSEQVLHAKLTMTLRRGQVFRHELPGAGGWGDPLARDLALVAKDLRDGLVSIEGAARDYGVVAHGDPPVIDEAATSEKRCAARLRATRPPLAGRRPARSPGGAPSDMSAAHRHRHRRHLHRPGRDRRRRARSRRARLPPRRTTTARASSPGLRELLADGAQTSPRCCTARRSAPTPCWRASGARTALITTRGFRDILEIRDLRMPVLYDIGWTKPRALVERRLRLEVEEKLRPDGSVAVPLDPASVDAAIAVLRAERVESVAICLLHSYANPAHERAVADRRARGAAGRRDLDQPRDPAGDQGIPAHQHHRDQRLRPAGGARLHHRAGRAAARDGDRCAAATDAVERRAGIRRVRRRRAGAHHRERAGGRGGRRRGAGAAPGRGEN